MGVTVREWKKAWWVFISYEGKRQAKRVGTGVSAKRTAHSVAVQLQARIMTGGSPFSAEKTGVLFEEYAKTWLDRIRHSRKQSTLFGYERILARELLPAFGGGWLTDITRERVKTFAYERLKYGHSPKTVQNTLRGLSSLLSHAVESGLIAVNVALKPGKFLPRISKRRSINPFTREEAAVFLAGVRKHAPRYFPFFLCALRTGMRLGELIALQWDDVDYNGRFIEVQRNCALRTITTPKSGENRRVDMSRELTQALKELQTDRQLEATVNQWANIPPWIFCNEEGGLLDPDNVRKRVFYPLLASIGSRRVRFHDLRHTFASLLLQQGESPVYVREQMGHSSIQVTVDLYGHLIPGGNKQAVDRLDDQSDAIVLSQVNAT